MRRRQNVPCVGAIDLLALSEKLGWLYLISIQAFWLSKFYFGARLWQRQKLSTG